MAKYLEISNNQSVVIDDSYNVPMLVCRGSVVTSSSNIIKQSNPDYSEWQYNYARFDYRGSDSILLSGTSSIDLGSATTTEEITARVAYLSNFLIPTVRCTNGDYAASVESVSFYYSPLSGNLYLSLTMSSDNPEAIIEYAIYMTKHAKPANETLAIFKEDGELLFDVRKPPMITIGSLYGDLNVWQHEAGSFDLTLPSDVSKDDCFITVKSGAPFYAAFKIGSGGVSFGSTPFKSVMSFPSANLLRVRVVRVRSVSGSNSAYGYGGFFENVVYCPFSTGAYF